MSLLSVLDGKYPQLVFILSFVVAEIGISQPPVCHVGKGSRRAFLVDSRAVQGNGFGPPAIRHDHIRNDVEVRSTAGSVVL
jgi:hypothetical protein